jgi:hypothetical protein
MLLRYCLGALWISLMAIQSGCCCDGPWPCGKTYCGTQCGCYYWHEWFSHKPKCCDPCDFCGDFTASHNPYVKTGPPYTRFGPIYSDGTGSGQAGSIGQMYPTPAGGGPAGGAAPDPGMFDDASPTTEELPGPTTSVPRGYPRTAGNYGTVDSPGAYRTLGRQSRARLFSR